MQPRIPLAFLATRAHCWLTVKLSSPSTPRSLSVVEVRAMEGTGWKKGGRSGVKASIAKGRNPAVSRESLSGL